MESRRLVVWISAGILGFQGATLAFDLLNCTVLSWLFVQRHGFALPQPQPQPPGQPQLGPPVQLQAPSAGAEGRDPFAPLPEPERNPAAGEAAAGLEQPPPAPVAAPAPSPAPPLPPAPQALPAPFDPVGLFCQRPQRRVDTAVSQGLSILAGLVLGGSLSAGVGGPMGRSSDRDPEPDPEADDPQERAQGQGRG